MAMLGQAVVYKFKENIRVEGGENLREVAGGDAYRL
jgi:hypothetical protein